MATLNISMPKAMREWIDAQIEGGEYANASDYNGPAGSKMDPLLTRVRVSAPYPTLSLRGA